MIKLSENKTSLCGLPITISALERIDKLIESYDDGKVGPAYGPRYVKFDYVAISDNVQIDRKIMVEALKKQRQVLVDYLATLGIDAEK